MANQKMQQAVDNYKSGNKQNAKKLLAELVKSEPDNASAWYILALCMDEREEKEYCLQRVLEINPEHQKARLALTRMDISSSEDEVLVSKPLSQKMGRSRYITLSLVFLLCVSVLWLYIEVGRVKIQVPITTLNTRVEINNQNISSLTTDFSTLASDLSFISTNISSMASELSYVGSIARNANRYAHSHPYSDIRLKRDISPLENALGNITMLQGVTFVWDSDNVPRDMNMTDGQQIGFIAQEVEEVYPELVSLGPNGYLLVDYDKVTPILVEAIKEQQYEISSLQQENADLEKRIELLEKIIYDQTTP